MAALNSNVVRQQYWRLLSAWRTYHRQHLAPWQRYRNVLSECRRPAALSGTRSRHMLLLAWFFPPFITGGVYRPTALVRYASAAGWSVTVLAGPEPEQPSAAGRYLAASLPASVTTYRIAEHDPDPYPRYWPRVDGGFPHVLESVERGIELASKCPPSVIVASGPPFHNFVAGALLARRLACRLVLDYRDEWTECPFDFVRPGPDDRGWEIRSQRQADLIVFTTRAHLDHALKAFPRLQKEKCRVVPNGWEPSDLPPESEAQGVVVHSAAKRAVVTFAGNLGDHTLPGEFLRAFAEAMRLRPDLYRRVAVRFVGQRSKKAEAQLASFEMPELLMSIDQVPKPEAFSLMRTSDALLLINTPALDRYVPGKLYDYIAIGKPVMVFGEGGEVGRIVTELGVGVVVPGGGAALADALSRLIERRLPMTDRETVSDWLDRHTREATSKQFAGLLDELCGEESGS